MPRASESWSFQFYGEVYEPVPEDFVRKQIHAGKLKAGTPLKRYSDDDWLTLDQFPEFARELHAPDRAQVPFEMSAEETPAPHPASRAKTADGSNANPVRQDADSSNHEKEWIDVICKSVGCIVAATMLHLWGFMGLLLFFGICFGCILLGVWLSDRQPARTKE